MASIFPPHDQGGVPPGPNVRNGYVPGNLVVGEGPLYVSAECSTVLTDEQLNAITSELLAAVDLLGYSWNSGKVTNLGDALVARLEGATEDFVNVTGDTMTGPLILARDPVDPLEAATKEYAVARAGDTMSGALILHGDPVAALEATPKQYVDAGIADLRTDAETAIDSLAAEVARRVIRSGDTMTGPLILAGPDSADPNAAMRKSYIDAGDNARVAKGGDTMTGLLVLSGDPAAPLGAATKQYVDALGTGASSTYVKKAGDVMTGVLTLSGDPANPLEAATKQYVDSQEALDASLFVHKAGDTMTGPLALAADPTLPLQAATKQYVDAHSGGGGGSGAGATFLQQQFTATAGQTVFNVAGGGYTVGKIVVTRGGTVQENADFTATDGATIVLGLACEAGEVIKVFGFYDVKAGLAMPRFRYIATAGQTTFSGPDANGATLTYLNAACILVFERGVLAPPTSYTATSGTSIVLNTGLMAGDVLEVATFSYVALVDGISYLTAQGLTTVQQDQARKNIYAAPADLLGLNSLVINGAFEVAQEYTHGTAISITAGNAYFICDGWTFWNALTNTMSVQTSQYQIAGNGGIQKYISINSASAQPAPSAGQYTQFRQGIEGYRISRLKWGNVGDARPITICLLISATKAGNAALSIRNGTADRSYVTEFPVAVGFNWRTVTIPPDTAANKWSADNSVGMYVAFCFACGSSFQAPSANTWVNGNYLGLASTTNFFDAAGSNISIAALAVLPGNVAPADLYQYANMMRPFDQEIALCHRYYERNDVGVWFTAALNNQPGVGTISDAIGSVLYKVSMRANPTVTLYSGGTPNQVFDYFLGAINGPFTVTGSVDGFNQVNKSNAFLQGRPIAISYRADARI